MRQAALAFFASVLLLGSAFAQEPSHSGIVISKDQVNEAVASMPSGGIADARLRVVSIDEHYNVGVSVVRRVLVKGKTPVDALQHHDITEVYQVIQGCGTLETGGTLNGSQEVTPDDKELLAEVGPTARGTSINGANARRVSVGDIVVVPRNTPHGFSQICQKGITYTLVRVDPGRVLPLK